MNVHNFLTKVMTVNHRFHEMHEDIRDFWSLRIIEGVLLLDEYRLYQWYENDKVPTYIVDVGGHYGSFTIMAKTLWPNATVVAYEPAMIPANRFRGYTARFTDVTLVEAAAVGKSRGPQVAFHMFTEEDSGNTIFKPDNREHKEIIVDAIPFVEDLNRRGRNDISILKLDCEGAELELLQDLKANEYLPKIGFIVGEWHVQSQLKALKELLEPTHITEFINPHLQNGGFFAWRR